MGLFLLLSFICFSLASTISSLLLFILPSSVNLLSALLPFPFLRLYAVLSRSLLVRSASLSVFHSGFLFCVPDFDPYFLVRSLRPRLLNFFGSVFLFLYFRDFPVLLSCVFLRYCAALSSHRLPPLFFVLLLVLLYCL